MPTVAATALLLVRDNVPDEVVTSKKRRGRSQAGRSSKNLPAALLYQIEDFVSRSVKPLERVPVEFGEVLPG